MSAEWRCTKIEDRNGNYISASYDTSNGHILTITDTLSRVITFNYNGDNNLSTITQTWGGATHAWATFNFTPVPMSFNFSGLTTYGAVNGSSQTVLSYITFPEGTSYNFDYNSYGQVYQIRHKAPDNHELEHTFYTINTSGAQTDCPRFTDRRDYAQDWNGNLEAITSYSVTTNATWTTPESGASQTGTLVQQTAPDGTIYKEYSHSSAWDSGLPQLTEFWFGGVKKKYSSTSWTQDNTALTYPQNPRVIEVNTYDDALNRRRITMDYTSYNLPSAVREWTGTGGNLLYRTTATGYNFDTAYTDRRIIGLLDNIQVTDGAGALVSKTTYSYDWDFAGDMFQDVPGGVQVARHDGTNYGPTFIYGRGNLSQVARYDVNDPNNANNTWQQTKWRVNITGSVLMQRDHLGHASYFDYGDSFSDGNNSRNTFAYVTKITDAEGNYSTVQYNYDFGAVTRSHTPTSGTGVNTTYLDEIRTYDAYGRLDKSERQVQPNVTHDYTRFFYEINGNYVHTYQTVLDLTQANEFHSWQIMDGAGRVRATASEHPGSIGGFRGQSIIYDNMGRVAQQSNPAEITSAWLPAGDDTTWRYTVQTYDWKGRPLVTTNTDGTTRIAGYGGCGCAGGEVTTIQDEHGRLRRLTKDTLGRLATVEELNWSGSVYASTSYAYNARDQITQSNQAGQVRSFAYDGRGRLQSRTTPEQGTMSYSYNADDTTNVVTDARGAKTVFTYNPRHLPTNISYDLSNLVPGQSVAATASVSVGYDAAGHRTSMNDGLGSVSYNYNNLAQLTSETRNFTGVGSYALTYTYNLADEVTSVTNPWNAQVSYSYDKAGQVTSVNGSGYAGVSSYASALTYRAFGALKSMNYANGRSLSATYDNRLRPTQWNVANVLGYNYNYDYFNEHTGRVTYAQNIASNGAADATLDRSYEYDNVGRLVISHSGTEARAHAYSGQWGTLDGPYSQGYDYDVWGNVTHKFGWGGEVQGGGAGQSSDIYYNYTNNRRNGFTYDATGNLSNDGNQSYSYDATGQQTSAAGLSGSAPTFTNNPLVVGVTEVRALHITELRDAINGLRARLGRSPFAWQTAAAVGDLIKADPIVELRTALDQTLGPPPSPGYAAGLAQGQPIKAIHIQELRNRVTAAFIALVSATLNQYYDGDTLRVKKTENGATTWYLRSSVLGGQVVAELDGVGNWSRGYVYAGSSVLAVQQASAVYWMHEDPVTKSKRVTNGAGATVSTIELDPWGADTSRSSSAAFQPRKFTSYERDNNGTDEAMFRRYNRWQSRFDQPDPYDGSYDFTDPQSFNRYAYVQGDPVNFVDPSGLMMDLITFGPHGELLGYSYGGDPASDYGGSDRGFFVNGVRRSNRIPGFIGFGVVLYDGRVPYGIQLLFGIGAPGGYMHGDPSRGGGRGKSSSSQTQPCDRSRAATQRAAQRVAGSISGARVGTQNGSPIINFSGGYNQTIGQLQEAGYYSGILAFNPIDHAGGYEFRTYGSPGFHFKVVYPDVKEIQVGGRMGVSVSDKPAVATDLHIDCNNPVGSGIGGTLNHGIDFAREHTPWWLPYLIPGGVLH